MSEKYLITEKKGNTHFNSSLRPLHKCHEEKVIFSMVVQCFHKIHICYSNFPTRNFSGVFHSLQVLFAI